MKYSKRSFHFAWISIVMLVIFATISQIPRSSNANYDMIISYLITFQYMSILIGFAFAMMSITEDRTRMQNYALIINIILFIGLAIFFLFNLK